MWYKWYCTLLQYHALLLLSGFQGRNSPSRQASHFITASIGHIVPPNLASSGAGWGWKNDEKSGPDPIHLFFTLRRCRRYSLMLWFCDNIWRFHFSSWLAFSWPGTPRNKFDPVRSFSAFRVIWLDSLHFSVRLLLLPPPPVLLLLLLLLLFCWF